MIVAEGYLLSLSRRGYVSHGSFIPDVVLEHPEMVRLLHYEFAHCGSDVMEAFQVRNFFFFFFVTVQKLTAFFLFSTTHCEAI